MRTVCRDYPQLDPADVASQVLKREEGISTTLDTGLSIPHARLEELGDFTAALAVLPEPLRDQTNSDLSIRVMFLFLSPAKPAFSKNTCKFFLRWPKRSNPNLSRNWFHFKTLGPWPRVWPVNNPHEKRFRGFAQSVPRQKVVVLTTAMLTFIPFWKAAAVVLCDFGSSAFYAGGIAMRAFGPAFPWYILAVMLFSGLLLMVELEACSLFVRGGAYKIVREGLGDTAAKLAASALILILF